jgi:hypothetical protein
VKSGDPLLPPQILTISLPALSPDEAEMILQLVDQLHGLLWEAYGDAVFDHLAEDHVADDSEIARPDDDGPEF